MRRRRINSGYSYNTERRNIDDGTLSSAKRTIGSVPVDIGEIQASVTEWERPDDWLTLPDDTLYDDVFIGLVAIEPSGSATLHYNISTTTGDDFIIDWGDGFSSSYADNTNASHSYDYDTMDVGTLSSRGYKQAVVVITPSGSGNIDLFRSHRIGTTLTQGGPSYLDVVYKLPNASSTVFGNQYYNQLIERFRLLEKSPSLTNFSNLFYGHQNLQKVEIDADTSNIVRTDSMFYQCNALKTIPYFDTSNVTNMASMFRDCYSLVYIPKLNTSKATNLSYFLNNCLSLGYVPELDTGNATTMQLCFSGCRSLKKLPKLNTSKVTNFDSTFNACSSLIEVPNWDYSNTTTVRQAFYQCSKLTKIPKVFDISSATDAYRTFRDCDSLTNIVLKVDSITRLQECFYNCTKLNSIRFINLTNSLDNLLSTFYNCTSLNKVYGLRNTENVTTFENTFYSCRTLEDIGNEINIDSATTMYRMFYLATSIKSIQLASTGSGLVTDMRDCFRECQLLEELPYIDTSNVTLFSTTFLGCRNITESPNYDFSSTTTLVSTYQQCYNLKTIPPINTPNATNSRNMFNQCFSLSDYSGSIDLSGVTTGYAMFGYCYSLRRLPPLDLSSMNANTSMDSNTTTGRFFYLNYNLRDVELNGLTRKVDLRQTQFDRDGLVKIFNSLGTAAGSQVINITAVPGAADLSAADLLIATNKGWTVTY